VSIVHIMSELSQSPRLPYSQDWSCSARRKSTVPPKSCRLPCSIFHSPLSATLSNRSLLTTHPAVPPAELEALLLTHPRLVDAGVIGIWSPSQATELPRAYVVPRTPLSSLSPAQRSELEQQVADWIAGKVANHKRLRGGVVLIDAVPKSPSGKILRKDLRELAKKEVEGGAAEGRLAKL